MTSSSRPHPHPPPQDVIVASLARGHDGQSGVGIVDHPVVHDLDQVWIPPSLLLVWFISASDSGVHAVCYDLATKMQREAAACSRGREDAHYEGSQHQFPPLSLFWFGWCGLLMFQFVFYVLLFWIMLLIWLTIFLFWVQHLCAYMQPMFFSG